MSESIGLHYEHPPRSRAVARRITKILAGLSLALCALALIAWPLSYYTLRSGFLLSNRSFEIFDGVVWINHTLPPPVQSRNRSAYWGWHLPFGAVGYLHTEGRNRRWSDTVIELWFIAMIFGILPMYVIIRVLLVRARGK